MLVLIFFFFFFQAEDGIRDAQESRGLGDVYKRQRRRGPGRSGSPPAMTATRWPWSAGPGTSTGSPARTCGSSTKRRRSPGRRPTASGTRQPLRPAAGWCTPGGGSCSSTPDYRRRCSRSTGRVTRPPGTSMPRQSGCYRPQPASSRPACVRGSAGPSAEEIALSETSAAATPVPAAPAAPPAPRPPVQLDRTDAVATITLDRPEARNALNTATKEALLAALTEVHADDAVRAVVVTGAGRAFCVGQDLREHADLSLIHISEPTRLLSISYA